MKLYKPLVMALGCCILLGLWGCREPATDKPGMEYIPGWYSFTLSGNGSVAQDNFWITVTDSGEDSVMTGEYRSDDGTYYLEETGISLPSETVWQLRRLNLEKLGDAMPETAPQEPMLLDGNSVSMTMVLPDGKTVEKAISVELSQQIREILAPCFSQEQTDQ